MANITHPERHGRTGGPGLSYLIGSKVLGVPLYMSATAGNLLRDALEKGQFDASLSLAIGGTGASKFTGTLDARSRFRVTDDGIAIVSVAGVLIDRGAFLGDVWGMMTSYEGLIEQFVRLSGDAAVKAVIIEIDSPGGMVAGVLDCCAALTELKKKKKVYAIAANMADSAAYAIGCVANELYVTMTGECGSIGVIAYHQSYQRALDASGIDTTIVAAGDHKADGNPFQQLGHGARAEMAAEVDAAYALFVDHVVKNRPLDASAVRATQARVFRGEQAVRAKLADGVKTCEELIAHVRKGLGSRGKPPATGGRTVSDNTNPAAGRDAPDYGMIAEAIIAGMQAVTAPRAPVPSQPAAAVQPAPAAQPAAPAAPAPQPAATEGRQRIKAILDSEQAKTRPGLARHLALERDFDVETSLAILGAAAAENAAAAPQSGLNNALAARMAEAGNSARVAPEAGGGKGSKSFADLCGETATKKRV